jgi:hypothetical protein
MPGQFRATPVLRTGAPALLDLLQRLRPGGPAFSPWSEVYDIHTAADRKWLSHPEKACSRSST